MDDRSETGVPETPRVASRRRLAILALVLVAASASALLLFGGGPRVHLDVEARDGTLSVRTRGVAGASLAIIVGRPRRGDDPIPSGHGRLRLVPLMPTPERPAPHVLIEGPLPAGREVELDFRASNLEGQSDPCVIQAVARPAQLGMEVPGASRAFLVEHGGGRLRVESTLRWFLVPALPGALLFVTLLLVVVLGMRRLRWPNRARVLGWPLLVAIIALTLAHRTTSSPGQSAVLASGTPPPLWWPADWPLDADTLDLVLGPECRELASLAREAQREGEGVTIWFSSEPIRQQLFAAHLAHLLDDAPTRGLGFGLEPEGLVILLDGRERGEVLARTTAGILARVTP